ncbi:MAG: class I SAM-dependent methyltransferase, partial [Rubripirellula sp.]
MTDDPRLAETREFWNRVAQDWDTQVGDTGDNNRRLNSDPVLWRLAGDVANRDVLDAGCGTGYLTRILAQRGARTIGVDLSESMLDIARGRSPSLDFRHDSCTQLSTILSSSTDLIVSNYVLMDCPDLSAAVEAFHRVLRVGGVAVLVFSHPCFPQGQASDGTHDGAVSYLWDDSYFKMGKRREAPWGHFTDEFIWFHRPLSEYWRVFQESGFVIES